MLLPDELVIVDSHLHLWDISRLNYPWLNHVPHIRRTFLADDYNNETKNFRINKMVFVQCECEPQEYREEVRFISEQTKADARISAIVAYAPMEKGTGARADFEFLSSFPLVKGVRRMYDDDPSIAYSKPFLDALNMLPLYNYSFDISCKPHVLPATIKMIKACPDTRFILDHMGKPDIKNNKLDDYKRNMELLAALPNVVAKLSGLVTEADPLNWTRAQLEPYVTYALEIFGTDRLMFGGDWPVVLLAGGFKRWMDTLLSLLKDLTDNELQKILYANAHAAYNL